MKLKIRYRTEYRYGSAVSLSPHTFRLFPKPDLHLKVERAEFQTNGQADVQYRRDLFDNIVAQAFYPEVSPSLEARLELDLDVQELNAFHFILDLRAAQLPFTYEAHERAVLDPYLKSGQVPVSLPFWKLEPGPTVSTLVELNRAIHDNLRYERREEGVARTARETLAAGGGACRDYAVLLAESLRSIGIAARLASGYLLESGGGERYAEGALHAWTEAFLPGAGWVGLDPTNGTFCNHCHVTAAVGLCAADIAPIVGSYYSNIPVSSSMSAALEIGSAGPG